MRSCLPVPPPNRTSTTTTQIPAARYAYVPRFENRPLQPSSRPLQPPTAPPRRLETIRPPPPTPESPLDAGDVAKPDITARRAGSHADCSAPGAAEAE
ncbi:hypothetical protein Zmor_015018 [Zophobas morio]|uniref:Uncharacterized protein n=1 Tax=Zophobas morio TaxID=2755281 RepID=A0AA38MGV7_9CUCU|nr:hypothetical protein Zmor_015018 [Zophobas morio]